MFAPNKPEFRRVRTPEGAAYYGLPIGSLIKPSAAKKVIKQKSQSWDGSDSPVSTAVAINEYLGIPGAAGDEGPEALNGPLMFEVQGEGYSAPKGSRLFSNADGSVKYVVTPDAHVVPFTPDAQITLAPALGKALHAQLTAIDGPPAKYSEEQFTKSGLAPQPSEATTAADAPLGTTVVSRNGDYSLTKTESGWEYPALGIEVDDETVQALMDKGDLSTPATEEETPVEEPTPDANTLPNPADEEAAAIEAAEDEEIFAKASKAPAPPEPATNSALDFASMDKEQFLAVLDGMPEGTSLYAKSLSTPKGYVTYTKSPTDSKWHADSGSVYSPNAMAYISKGLSTDIPADAVQAPEPTLAQVAPKMTAAMKAQMKSVGLEVTPAMEENLAQAPTAAPVVTYAPMVANEDSLQAAHTDKAAFINYLNGLPSGTKIFFKDGESVTEYTKADAGIKWETNEGDEIGPGVLFAVQPGSLSHADPFSAPISNEEIASVEDSFQSAAASLKQEPEQDLTGDVQVIPEGKMIPKAQVVAAIESLEGHSGFQVAYGLKGLPEGNPFTDIGFQNQIKDYASEQFPDLKPKPAFVAYLKAKAGFAEPVAVKDTGAKTINIGSASPKQVGVQGYDGGVFSEQDIQEAITLLEGFEGKAFKAYLNKNNNALGVLDPTKIVGFNKDKTVMKKDFIALLKQKVPTAAPAAQEPENDGQIVPMAENESVAPLAKPTLEMLEKVGDGSSMVVTWDGEDHDFEKVNDQWVMEGSTKPLVDKSFHTLLNSEGTTVSEINLFPKAAQPEIKTDGVFTPDDALTSPVGTHVEVWDSKENQSHLLHKTEDGWQFKASTNNQPSDVYYPDSDMQAYAANPDLSLGFAKPDSTFVQDAKNPGVTAPPSAEPTPIEEAVVAPALDYANPSLLDFIGAKPGSVVQIIEEEGNTEYWVKTDADYKQWIRALDAGGEPIDAGTTNGQSSANIHLFAKAPGSTAFMFEPNTEAGKPVYAQQAPAALKVNGPTPDKFKSGDADPYEINNAPVGTSILLQVESKHPDENGADYVLTKATPDTWTVVKSSDGFFAVGDQWSNAQVKSSLLGGSSVTGYWVDMSQVEQGGPPASGPQEITKDNVSNLAVGTVLEMVDKTAPPAIYIFEVTKIGSDSWEISKSNNDNVFETGQGWNDFDVASMVDNTAGVSVKEKGVSTAAPNTLKAADIPGLTVGSKIHMKIHGEEGVSIAYEFEKSSESEWVVTATENKYIEVGATWTDAKVINWTAGIGNNTSTVYLMEAGPEPKKTMQGNPDGYGSAAHLKTLWEDKDGVVKIYPDDDAPITAMPAGSGKWNVLQGNDATVMTHEGLSGAMKGKPGWAVHYGTKVISPANGADETPASTPVAPVVTNPTGLEPGKYVSGGKAYMIVKADGKGLYVDSKGVVTSLTAAKVKANHAAGMNKHEPLPDVIPSVTPVKVTKVATVDKIEDGTYFSGDPNDVKTPVYTVANGEVTITKPKTSTEGSTSKVGSKTTQPWVDAASVGAKVKVFNDVYVKVDTGLTGQSWKHAVTGEPVSAYHWDKIRPSYAYYSGSAIILSHGTQEPVTVPLAKAKTLFATGKLMDMYGNSVVPEGYSGAVFFYGSQTTMPALAKAKQHLELDPETYTTTTQNHLMTLGVKVNPALLKKKTLAEAGGEEGVEKNGKGIAYNKILMATLESFLDGVEVEEPEGDAKEFFSFNSQAEADFPNALATMNTGSKPEKNAWIKAASLAVGDGAIIGLNPTKLADYEADQWISAFRSGNFKLIYSLDVAAAGKPGAKPMLEGYKHPGSPENEDTHTIAWQPAVEGEISALKDIPGNWTALSIPASMAEIDNYLISAQMQNPTYLSPSEKRMWVTRHRQNNKPAVDSLSVLAEQRKEQGVTTLSEPIAWTDDVKPAKSYDSLFDDTIHPTEGWTTAKAQDYYNDFKDENPDLVKAFEAATGYNDAYKAQSALVTYFSAEKEKAYQISLIPVYTKKPIQTVKQGTHPISQWTDQFGNEYFYKPRPKGMEFRADIEMLGNSLGRFWGFDSAAPQIKGLDGFEYGLLMKGVPAVGDLMNADLGSLTGAQVGDIASEHVLDWMLDNDDTKGDNALITPDGKIVGIDKGRTFVSYGHWDGLNPNGMNTNAHTVFSRMFHDIEDGKISKEVADAAYLKMQKRIKRIMKSDAEMLSSMVTDAMKNRDKGYKVPYSIDGKQVPQTLEGLLMAIEDRKSRLDTDFENLWAKTYKKAGYGDLPEVPLKAVDGIISGFSDPDLAPDILKAQTHSKSTIIGGAHVHAGDVQIWTDRTPDEQTNVEGRMFLSFRAQDQMLSTLKGMATPEAQTESGAFPSSLDIFWNPFFVAAKTVNHHSADGEYNMTSIAAWEEKEQAVNADLLAWSPDLKASTVNGVEVVAFPSGNKVPRAQMGQYKMMLDHYVQASAAIKKGYTEKAKIIPHIEQYASVTIVPNEYYTSPDKQSTAVKLGTGKWLVTDFTTGTVSQHAADSTVISGIKENWVTAVKEKPDTKGFKVVLMNHTHENPATIGADNVKQIKSEASHSTTGVTGQEYEITLPTGEKIYYRNYGQTGTVRSQSGMLSFRAKGVGSDEASMSTAFENVQAALETLGLETAPAEEEDAQNIYWREMYDLFMHRNANGATSAHKAFQKDIEAKKKEILKGAEDKYFLEDLSASFDSAAAEAAYWRELYSKHFGTAVIDKVISERAYLPKFDHFKVDDAELETGHPYWIRFDITLEQIRAAGKILGSTSSKEPVYKVKAGGNLGAEERFRYTGEWSNGMSATSDQQYGSSHNVYTRIQNMNGGSYSGYRTFYDPAAMLRTRTYSFDSDNYGRLDNRKGSAPMDPTHALKNFEGGSNETMLPHGASLLDTIEMYVFESATARQEAIDYLKKRNLAIIRGLPVEDRLVMRSNLAAAMAKVKASWTK